MFTSARLHISISISLHDPIEKVWHATLWLPQIARKIAMLHFFQLWSNSEVPMVHIRKVNQSALIVQTPTSSRLYFYCPNGLCPVWLCPTDVEIPHIRKQLGKLFLLIIPPTIIAHVIICQTSLKIAPFTCHMMADNVFHASVNSNEEIITFYEVGTHHQNGNIDR